MQTFETAGHALLQTQDANRSLAFAIARALSAVFSAPAVLPRDRPLAGATFQQLEPGLAKEAGTSDYIRSF